MTTKNLIVASILVLASLAALPVAAAADLPDVAAPSCSVDCIKDKVCAYGEVNCDIECAYTMDSSGIGTCAPICPMLASEGASYACPAPCPLSLSGTQSAYICPLPCVSPYYTGAIACPRPPCDYMRALGTPCPICPGPSGSMQACSVCPSGVSDLCGYCDRLAADPCETTICIRDRECYPEPVPITCTVGPDSGDGVIPDTIDYASEVAIVTLCVIVLPQGNVVIEQVGDTAYFAVTEAYATVDYAEDYLTVGCCVRAFDDHGLTATVVGTAGTQAALACDYLADAGPLCYGGTSPSPGNCPATPPTSGGVIGDTLDFGAASCGNAAGGAGGSSVAALAIAADAQAAATGAVSGVAGSVGGFADDRAADAEAVAAEKQGNAEDGASYVLAGAAYAKDATCTYLFGNTACQP